jgi:hypothetical protein
MMSIWSHDAPFFMVFEQSSPRAAKSAERIEGAIMAGGDMVRICSGGAEALEFGAQRS